ncbi:MAG: hypothetical protein HUJ68_02955, partial [Clostridia bacterium]|nr:hypothetical protein [Clostridia bacterium]
MKDKVDKPEDLEALKKASKGDLITIISILREELSKAREDKSKKDKTKSECAIIRKTVENTSLSERFLCALFNMNRKTYLNYKNIKNHGVINRKDFKHNNPEYRR